MVVSVRDLTRAICEHDFAMRAASYGSKGSRDVLIHAIRNLPPPEFERLRAPVQAAIDAATERTTAALTSLGCDVDMPHPFLARASFESPDALNAIPNASAPTGGGDAI